MIVIWSEASRSNSWVNQEIGAALYKGIPVIPLIQEGVTPEAILEGIEGTIYDPNAPFNGIKNLIGKLEQQLDRDGYQRLDKNSALQRLNKAWSIYQSWQQA